MDSVTGSSSIDLELARFMQAIADLETPLSPKRTIVLPVIQSTPQGLRTAEEVIVTTGLRIKLTPNRDGILRDGMRILRTFPIESQRELYISRVRAKMLGDGVPLSSPTAVKRVHELLQGPGASSASLVVTETNRGSSIRFVAMDLTHIVDGHFCPLTDPRRGLIKEFVVNPDSGVGAGWYMDKFSTFFPDSIVDKDQLTTALTIPSWEVYKKGGANIKAFCQVSDGAKTFYAIQHLQSHGASIRTCYPLFFAKDIDEIESDISVEGVFSIKKDDVIAYFERAVRNRTIKDLIVFTLKTGQLLIRLDGFPDIPLPKGVYLFVRPEVIGLT